MASASSVPISANALRTAALNGGRKGTIKANIRLLIDKMLARYSSDFVVCRELIQNADDAQATWFHFDIQCQPFNDQDSIVGQSLPNHSGRKNLFYYIR